MAKFEIDKTLPFYEVRKFLARRKPGKRFDAQFARFVRLPVGPSYSTDLNAVVAALNKRKWWWHLSHLEASIIPTGDAPGLGGIISNSTAYDREGNPIRYVAICADQRPALALCEAWVKAAYDLPVAFFVVASAIEEAVARVPCSRERMMAYYEALEKGRQERIAEFEAGLKLGSDSVFHPARQIET